MFKIRFSTKCGGGGGGTCNYKTILSVVLSGYTNEVGEAFRAQVPVRLVHLSYVVASGYVVADAVHKGWEASQVMIPDRQTNGHINTERE